MGIAQDVGVFIHLAETIRANKDIGFLFVGRGSEYKKLKNIAFNKSLENVMFFNEIPPEELPGLFNQCHFGLVALDKRHKTHNIPGKLITYLQNGLPILASVNPNNDLIELIYQNDIGYAETSSSIQNLYQKANLLVAKLDRDSQIQQRCSLVAKKLFSPSVAVKQIISSLSKNDELIR